jgi:hypothetical protein
MDDAFSVRRFESIGNLNAQAQDFRNEQWCAIYMLAQSNAIDILDGKKRSSILLADVVIVQIVGCESLDMVRASRSRRWRTHCSLERPRLVW